METKQPDFLSQSKDECGVGFIAHRHGEASYDILEKACTALKNLKHRGAIDADKKTGDGSGLLTPIPKEFYIKKALEENVRLPSDQPFAIAMIFYPQNTNERKACRELFHSILKKYDLELIWTREVPVDESILGDKARKSKPYLTQKFLKCPDHLSPEEFEKQLFLIRKEVDIVSTERGHRNFYIPNISCKTIIHKGLFVGDQVREFYLDLKDPDYKVHFALFHQRFSTNTFPTWSLAQPFRMMAHNGEINTLHANRNWMKARTIAEQPRAWVPEHFALSQIIIAGRSDSASFDNMLEAYRHFGRSILHSIVHIMPEAWQHNEDLDSRWRAFYEYHACLSEPWDGPAAVAFTDSHYIGAIVDRNGLRPARYKITKDHLFVCSEMGVIEFPVEDVEENGKLSPGMLIAFDLKKHKILKNKEIKDQLAGQKPYEEWLKNHLIKLEDVLEDKKLNPLEEPNDFSEKTLSTYQQVFGYSGEDYDFILKPMFKEAKEPIGSMGDDTPLAVFSQKPRLLYTYFKQLFAQVTNPAIDPIREEIVMSLRMYLGKSQNVFEENSLHARQIRIRAPILTQTAFHELISQEEIPAAILPALFSAHEEPNVLEESLLNLGVAAEKAVDEGKSLIVISDRHIDKDHAPIPMLLAVSSVHHHLIRQGKRLNVSLLVETGEAREVHHFATLIGFGASAIYPYLALKTVMNLADSEKITSEEAIQNYITASEKGLLKIMSKMGISTLQSYHAAQLFEIIGLKESVVKYHFTGTPLRLHGGANLTHIAKDYLSWHQEAYQESEDQKQTVDLGFYRFRRDGEYHAYNPQVIKSLHKAVSKSDFAAYQEYKEAVNQREPMTIRDLLRIKKGNALDLNQVEEGNEIAKRFCTPGISYGAISKETHEDFAIAMNRIGAKSDSGEGGEDAIRYKLDKNGDSKNSAIKQVASGRFGVTAYYLSQAQELEIKIAQGAKPGEGGQLPGHKVSEDIARVRHSTPGVTLISPPPHHDIYSIEDLAQLIYDLKRSNPKAKVCVKLVSEAGIGTIAAGVVKAHADTILVSGHDGGTGASPLSSIKHAGLPWELGLSEVQQVLVYNRLRDRIRLRVDGGFKTGQDVVKAALFGAEEFGFGTASMVAAGCVMVRKCHLNTCPVGIATQNPKLREKYKGTPERIINFFHFVAEEVRMILAEMGYKSLDEIIGRVDLLEQVEEIKNEKCKNIQLKRLIRYPYTHGSSIKNTVERNDWEDDDRFDEQVIEEVKPLLETGKNEKILKYKVRNTQRSIGTRLSYEIVSRHGPEGLPDGKIRLELTGTAGQSFGAFGMKTLEMHLEGEANDYVGKGLSGALLSLRPPQKVTFPAENNIICGNTCLYGATSGNVFINGRAGERFAVRNSGADAVVEGIGDHGCEYMTGGRVLLLGSAGYNFGAGMTGGLAYIYDPQKEFAKKCNLSEIKLFDVDWNTIEADRFKELLEEHVKWTKSDLGTRLLQNWDREKPNFLRVVPKEILALEDKLKNSKIS